MKFFNSSNAGLPASSRPLIFLIAIILAIGMWYIVVIHDTADFEIEVIINYRGLPKKLFVTSGLVYRVRERIRGPKMLKNALPETVDLPIDISGLKVGDAEPTNVFSVIDEQKKLFSSTLRRAFKILYIDPAVIRLHAEYIDRINMPIHINFISDSQIVIRKISNQSIALHGPESEIKKLEKLTTFPINVTVDFLDVGKNNVVKDVSILIPAEYDCPHVTAEPSSIKIEYIVKGERVDVVRLYPISLSVSDATMYKVSPELVQLTLKVPSNKKNDVAYLNELRVTALPPDLNVGESKNVSLNFTPPDGMEVADEHKTVTITRISADGLKHNASFQTDKHSNGVNRENETKKKRRNRAIHDRENSKDKKETDASITKSERKPVTRRTVRPQNNSKQETKKNSTTSKETSKKQSTNTKPNKDKPSKDKSSKDKN